MPSGVCSSDDTVLTTPRSTWVRLAEWRPRDERAYWQHPASVVLYDSLLQVSEGLVYSPHLGSSDVLTNDAGSQVCFAGALKAFQWGGGRILPFISIWHTDTQAVSSLHCAVLPWCHSNCSCSRMTSLTCQLYPLFCERKGKKSTARVACMLELWVCELFIYLSIFCDDRKNTRLHTCTGGICAL